MPKQAAVSLDDLLALAAGTLGHENFVRVARAVKNSPALQRELANFELIRNGLMQSMLLEHSPAKVDALAESVLAKLTANAEGLTAGPSKTAKPASQTALSKWLERLRTPRYVGWAYGVLATQTLAIAWLATSVMVVNDPPTATSRTAGPDSKQLGTVPESVIFSVSFDPATSESTVRGLLLELQAQIISGPTQLGQYRISVARNRAHFALLKLREAAFVEQVLEINN